ncbi:hypothetical protein SAMN06297129_3267 [Pseudooceanicola antarcticus]|uniref:Uncharacterized protein n=1 Tax=Pseudooceanicola antarcticus TaxID=1247613 RepID=A0A285J805_9RHOB|nr:hypothetical protein [Pseudooceanicola antarcticus]PJE27069.1 hypothetical protein CVM39_17265 [Pseudooceanicola antarcticus]SNY56352.1 hypothetical protein SAMN06297129_3267 [Pseudooceanicola antarcticus]
MAERARSKDLSRETEAVLGESPEEMEDTPSHGGRKGGEIQRKVGTRDEQKLDGGVTTPKAQDQDGSGDKENV